MRWIRPRRSGLKWQDNQWNRPIPRKQMTTDVRRLMLPGAVLQRSSAYSGCRSVLPSCLTSTCRVSDSGSARGYGGPYEGLSRMRGNSQVRFLGGRGRATVRAYPAHPEATLRLPRGYPEATRGRDAVVVHRKDGMIR